MTVYSGSSQLLCSTSIITTCIEEIKITTDNNIVFLFSFERDGKDATYIKVNESVADADWEFAIVNVDKLGSATMGLPPTTLGDTTAKIAFYISSLDDGQSSLYNFTFNFFEEKTA